MGSPVKMDSVFISITDGQFPASENPQAVFSQPFKVHPPACIIIQVTRELYVIRFRRPCNETYFSICIRMGTQKFIGIVMTSQIEEHTSELQSRFDLVCRLLLVRKKRSKSYRIIKNAAVFNNYSDLICY